MFQRQARQAFPIRNIVVLAAAVLLFFLYIAQNLRKNDAPAKQERQEAEAEKHDSSSLEPAEWFHIVREYPDFRPDIKTYAAAMKQAREGVASRNQNQGFSAPWTVQGPGNIGARVNAVKIHPTNPNIIYVGYSGGGLWKTVNGGQSWQPIFDQQNYLSIGAITLDPQNPNIVYVGTGDPNISILPFIGDGVWKSPDGGQTWQHLGLVDQRIITKIVINPSNSNILYASTMGLPFERNNKRGLYKSTNGGQTWQQSLFVSDQAGAIDLEMSPADPNVLYVAMWDRIRNNQESLVSGPNAKIWKTTDAGANWTVLGGGLPEDDQCRIGIDIDRNNANHIVAIYAGVDLSFNNIFESFDAGQSWQPMALQGLDPNFQSNFAWYFGKIWINPFDSNDIIANGVTQWRTNDGGDNWYQAVPDWWTYEVHADGHCVDFFDANTYLLGTDGGLYRTIDAGATWTKIENIPTTQFYRVAYNPFFPDWYYGGAQDNGTTAGNSSAVQDWPRLFGGDGFQAAFHPEDPNIYYFETQNGNIYGTYDGSGNFEDATLGIDPADRKSWDMQYFISANDPDYMYTGTYRVYQGVGHLPFWAPISEDLTDGVIFGDRFHTISTLGESTVNPDHLYVGTTDGNVWVGNPNTSSWTNITGNLPDRYVSSVKASPSEAERVFVSHTGYKANDFTPHIHRSDNAGASWTPISGDLPNFAVNDLLILPGHQDSVIFAGTDAGVYATLNGGAHWERLGAGMPQVPVYDIEFNFEKKTIFAGTHARSIYAFPLDSLKLGTDVSTFTPGGSKSAVMAVLPNLISAGHTAKVVIDNLKSKQTADVILTDMNGRLIWQSQCKGYGRHELPLETQSLPAGVYVAFARTDGRVWAHQKIVVAGK
jgi:photosystem II stability/assembly factor-like uncharacterized protein